MQANNYVTLTLSTSSCMESGQWEITLQFRTLVNMSNRLPGWNRPKLWKVETFDFNAEKRRFVTNRLKMPLKEGSWMIPKPGSKVSWLWRASSKFTVAVIGLSSKFWIEWMNKVRVHNQETLYDLIEKRSEDQGLLTVCNHTSCMDDPLIWGTLRPRILRIKNCMRWTSAAEDICFTNKAHALLFSLGQVFPLVRGDGVYQKGVDFSIEQLDLGSWCHYFPEGRVNMTQELMRLKWGIGRIISECKKTPIVLPIWHVGMDKVLPNKKPYIPRIRKHVTMLIGKPMRLEEEVKKLKSSKKSPLEIRKHITDIIQAELWAMRTVAEALYADETASS